jgi:hypothetical protein
MHRDIIQLVMKTKVSSWVHLGWSDAHKLTLITLNFAVWLLQGTDIKRDLSTNIYIGTNMYTHYRNLVKNVVTVNNLYPVLRQGNKKNLLIEYQDLIYILKWRSSFIQRPYLKIHIREQNMWSKHHENVGTNSFVNTNMWYRTTSYSNATRTDVSQITLALAADLLPTAKTAQSVRWVRFGLTPENILYGEFTT